MRGVLLADGLQVVTQHQAKGARGAHINDVAAAVVGDVFLVEGDFHKAVHGNVYGPAIVRPKQCRGEHLRRVVRPTEMTFVNRLFDVFFSFPALNSPAEFECKQFALIALVYA